MKEQNREASWLCHVLNHICSTVQQLQYELARQVDLVMNLIMCLSECSKI